MPLVKERGPWQDVVAIPAFHALPVPLDSEHVPLTAERAEAVVRGHLERVQAESRNLVDDELCASLDAAATVLLQAGSRSFADESLSFGAPSPAVSLHSKASNGRQGLPSGPAEAPQDAAPADPLDVPLPPAMSRQGSQCPTRRLSCPESVLLPLADQGEQDALLPLANDHEWTNNRRRDDGLLYCAANVLQFRGSGRESQSGRWQAGALSLLESAWASGAAGQAGGRAGCGRRRTIAELLAEGASLEEVRSLAAVIIQSYCRGWQARKMAAAMRAHRSRTAAEAAEAEAERAAAEALAKEKADVRRQLRTAARDCLLAVQAQQDYERTRARLAAGRGLGAGAAAMPPPPPPTVPLHLWARSGELGLDPIQVLLDAGLQSRQIEDVIASSQLAAALPQRAAGAAAAAAAGRPGLGGPLSVQPSAASVASAGGAPPAAAPGGRPSRASSGSGPALGAALRGMAAQLQQQAIAQLQLQQQQQAIAQLQLQQQQQAQQHVSDDGERSSSGSYHVMVHAATTLGLATPDGPETMSGPAALLLRDGDAFGDDPAHPASASTSGASNVVAAARSQPRLSLPGGPTGRGPVGRAHLGVSPQPSTADLVDQMIAQQRQQQLLPSAPPPGAALQQQSSNWNPSAGGAWGGGMRRPAAMSSGWGGAVGAAPGGRRPGAAAVAAAMGPQGGWMQHGGQQQQGRRGALSAGRQRPGQGAALYGSSSSSGMAAGPGAGGLGVWGGSSGGGAGPGAAPGFARYAAPPAVGLGPQAAAARASLVGGSASALTHRSRRMSDFVGLLPSSAAAAAAGSGAERFAGLAPSAALAQQAQVQQQLPTHPELSSPPLRTRSSIALMHEPSRHGSSTPTPAPAPMAPSAAAAAVGALAPPVPLAPIRTVALPAVPSALQQQPQQPQHGTASSAMAALLDKMAHLSPAGSAGGGGGGNSPLVRLAAQSSASSVGSDGSPALRRRHSCVGSPSQSVSGGLPPAGPSAAAALAAAEREREQGHSRSTPVTAAAREALMGELPLLPPRRVSGSGSGPGCASGAAAASGSGAVPLLGGRAGRNVPPVHSPRSFTQGCYPGGAASVTATGGLPLQPLQTGGGSGASSGTVSPSLSFTTTPGSGPAYSPMDGPFGARARRGSNLAPAAPPASPPLGVGTSAGAAAYGSPSPTHGSAVVPHPPGLPMAPGSPGLMTRTPQPPVGPRASSVSHGPNRLAGSST